MLKVYTSLYSCKPSMLMDVYSQSIGESAAELYLGLSPEQQLLEAEQDFYAFLKEFFKVSGAVYAVWEVQGRYVAALRFEPYNDGYLLQGLETRPDSRRKGYAYMLLCAALDYLGKAGASKIYSHVAGNNIPSLSIHKKCGFQKYLDHAAFIDGSVDHRSVTLLKII